MLQSFPRGSIWKTFMGVTHNLYFLKCILHNRLLCVFRPQINYTRELSCCEPCSVHGVLSAAIAGSLKPCYKISIAIKYSLNSPLPMKSRQSRGSYPPVMWHDRFSEQAWLHNDSFEGELNRLGFIFLHCVCLRSHRTRQWFEIDV